MTHTIAVSNQKGGVGKTTSVINLSSYCALSGMKVLIIDNDPQGNSSSVFLGNSPERSIYSGPTIFSTGFNDLKLIPAGQDLSDQEQILSKKSDGIHYLKNIIKSIGKEFDLIVIDCPPNLSRLSTNAIVASDSILVPLQCEYFAMEGLTQLLAYLDELRRSTGSTPRIGGILLTMYDADQQLAHQVMEQIRLHFGSLAFETVIPRDVALAAAPSDGKTIIDYDPLGPGAIAYMKAAKELLYAIERK